MTLLFSCLVTFVTILQCNDSIKQAFYEAKIATTSKVKLCSPQTLESGSCGSLGCRRSGMISLKLNPLVIKSSYRQVPTTGLPITYQVFIPNRTLCFRTFYDSSFLCSDESIFFL